MLEWYAYKHVNGTLHIKRFLGDMGDIEEARMSPFVAQVVGPWESETGEEAKRIMHERLG